MTAINIIGVDLAKNSFHVWGSDFHGKKVVAKKLSRSKFSEFMANLCATKVVMEACSSAHHWARCLQQQGHQVKLINPAFVRPFVKSNKNDFNDAEAIVEAGSRKNMRFVPIKTIEQQDMLSIHRARESVLDQRTQLANQMRSLLAERGIVTAKGLASLRRLISELLAPEDQRLTSRFKEVLEEMNERFSLLDKSKKKYDQKLEELSRSTEACGRLQKIPGIGPICATALVSTVGNGHDFKRGRDMSAWLGLVPGQHTTGGKPKLLGISKRGDRYLRKQLIHGARAVLVYRDKQPEHRKKWICRLMEKSPNIAAVALANKNARVAWALLKHGTEYRKGN